MHKVFHRVMWKAGKRCRRQKKRPTFEAAAVISALSEAGITSAATVYNKRSAAGGGKSELVSRNGPGLRPLFGAGNRLAGRCFCGEALPEAE